MRPIHLIPISAVALLFVAGPGLAHDHGERERERERGEPEERGERHGRRDRAEPERRRTGAPAPRAAVASTAVASTAEVLYRKECGACHLAYPPNLLPAASWRRTMAGLERHFGQNAELDAETGASLEGWLAARADEAGDRRHGVQARDGEAPLRISDTPRFRRKHRKIDPGVLARPSIRSYANCAACHAGAGEWDFDDDGAKIPAR